jgi:uncharacterized RDD family membrane protein YckC
VSTALSAPQQTQFPAGSSQVADWKQQLAEHLEAYRAKHGDTAQYSSHAAAPVSPPANSRAASIARAVASRYAEAPSYSELMRAAEARERERLQELAAAEEQARQQARAAEARLVAAQAEEAARERQEALPLFTDSGETVSSSQVEVDATAASETNASQSAPEPRVQTGKAVMPRFAERSQDIRMHLSAQDPEPTLEELLAASVVEPPSYLPSKLIEFPRELVSAHKARLRGPEVPAPLGDAAPAASSASSSQLRIFEVQAEVSAKPHVEQAMTAAEAAREQALQPAGGDTATRSSQGIPGAAGHASPTRYYAPNYASNYASKTAVRPDSTPSTAMPAGKQEQSRGAQQNSAGNTASVRAFRGLEWAAISLDREPEHARREAAASAAEYAPPLVEPASIDRRVMAMVIDFSLVTAGFLAFLAVFAASTTHIPTGLTAVVLAGAVYCALWTLYQLLFFSLSGATAGMLYARIALCSFEDQNPTRAELRRRIAVWWLSCLPLGLGFFWSFLDEDNLCWHDRITRTYLRTY